MRRVDASYPYHCGVDPWDFKNESETETKSNSGAQVRPLFACKEHAQSTLHMSSVVMLNGAPVSREFSRELG